MPDSHNTLNPELVFDRITLASTDPLHRSRVRNLPLTAFEVYHQLHFKGLSEDQVLEAYPELEREDFAAVEAFMVAQIRARTHDEITHRRILPKEELKHGIYYKGRCRNATIARWSAEEQCFYHWREKLANVFIRMIKYPTDEAEPWWDVFDVIEELPGSKFEIPFDKKARFMGHLADLREFDEEMWTSRIESVAVLQAKRRERVAAKKAAAPEVGIFFLVGDRLFVDGTSVQDAEPYGECQTHAKGHDAYWEELLVCGAVPGGDYEEFPRGRVVYNRTTRGFTLYADKCVLKRPDLVEEIKARLHLSPRTRTETDLHYRCPVCLGLGQPGIPG